MVTNVEEVVLLRSPATPRRRLDDRGALARHWLVLAAGALGASGVLALGLVLARVPALAHHLTNTDLVLRVLVVHVGLGIVIWFSALPVTLFHLHRLAVGSAARARPAAALAPWLSTAGALALFAGLLPGLGTVHPVNYVPLVGHPLYAAGLGLFFAGVGLSYLERGAARQASVPAVGMSPGARLPEPVIGTLVTTGRLIDIGAFYVLLALAAAGMTFVRLPGHLDEGARIEVLAWGPGHILQLANVAFVLVAWALLAAWGTGRGLGRRPKAAALALAAPLPPIFVLLLRGPQWSFSRDGYVLVMQWALFPAVLVFLVLVLVLGAHFSSRQNGMPAPARAALWPLAASVLLMLVGLFYGTLIRGSDLRIPGHYHACIGAITLAYMALTLLLGGTGTVDPSATLRRVAVLYGLGQFLFSTGLVLAGSYGLGRKTYGIEQRIEEAGQGVGIWIAAAGGILALAGGTVWAVCAWRWLRGPRETFDRHGEGAGK